MQMSAEHISMSPARSSAPVHDVVIIGGGAAGCAVAASLLRRQPSLSLAIIEPCDKHYYQPAWTLTGGGVFNHARTERPMRSYLPRRARWIQGAVKEFLPERNMVVLENGQHVHYRALIVCPGLKLDVAAVEGLKDTLGKNGVTSNYFYDAAPYTWEMVKALKRGTAIFTQPLMPIKCAGAPQKAMYLSCDYWRRNGVLDDISVEFNNANPSLFGIKEFVPPLMAYVDKYKAKLCLNSSLKAVNGASKRALFEIKREDGGIEKVEKPFDMLHVVPPQCAPDFIKSSPLANASGWVDVNQETLQHARYPNVFSLGDAASTPNAKTAAAVRKQAPIVAENVLCFLQGHPLHAAYDGYGACPLTVERGKVILAEFGYNGKLLPTFPLDPTKARRSAWMLKRHLLPSVYWDLLLKGREWLAKPKIGAPAPSSVAERKAA